MVEAKKLTPTDIVSVNLEKILKTLGREKNGNLKMLSNL